MHKGLRLVVCLSLVVAASGCVGGSSGRDAAPSGAGSHHPGQPAEPVAIGNDSPVSFLRYQGHAWRASVGFWVSRRGRARKRVALPREIQVGQPTLSPNGSSIVFVDAQVYGDGAEAIVLARLDRGDLRVLLRGVNLNSNPTWSPNGRRLTFSAFTNRLRGPCLFVMDVASGTLTRLTSPHRRVHDFGPVWSSDGRTILFSRHTSAGWRAELIDVRTRRVRPLPAGHDKPNIRGLTWQPHGQLIAAQDGQASSAVVLTTPTSTRLTKVPLDGAPLGWSADGRFPAHPPTTATCQHGRRPAHHPR